MSELNNEGDIQNILQRLQRLELENQNLKAQVFELQSRNQSNIKGTINTCNTQESHSQKKATAEETINTNRLFPGQSPRTYKDRDGNILQIGNKVHILTKGAYKSRSGRIHRFDNDWVTILDEDNIQQSRLPHNLRINTYRK